MTRPTSLEPTVDDVQTLIDKTMREIAELRATGTQRMSKTGVKWCISSNRDALKRLKAWKRSLQEAQHAE